jgi:hypothetical protein
MTSGSDLSRAAVRPPSAKLIERRRGGVLDDDLVAEHVRPDEGVGHNQQVVHQRREAR